MIERLATQIMRLSRRERWLLLLAFLLALPLGIVFAIAEPLADRRLAAQARLAEMQAQRDWLQARQTELAQLPVAAAPATEPVFETRPVGLGGIEARLSDAGLREYVALLAAPAGGAVAIQLEGVRFIALMEWVETVEAEAGYALGALRLRRGDEPGTVSADLQLEPRS